MTPPVPATPDPRPTVTAPSVPSVLSVLSVGLALALYAVLWVGWEQNWSWIAGVDAWALDSSHRLAEDHGWWEPLWDGLSIIFNPAVWRVLVVIPVAVGLYRREFGVAGFLAVSVWGSGLVSQGAKFLADRDRPDTRLVEASGSSFPSGHALGVLVAVGALLLAYPHLVRGYRRTAAVAGTVGTVGAVLVVAIGVARVALNVHHPSDVIAGWALGYAWLMLCLYFYRGRYTGNTR